MQRPTLIAGATVALVVPGLLLGVQWDNLHNGLLALSFAAVGTFVLSRRPQQREALLFLAAGLAQAVMFLGRQVGGAADPPLGTSLTEWVAWFGIWPLPLVLALVGATVMCFPDGRFPGRRWFVAFVVMAVAASALALMSALWPVDYDRAGLLVDHPLDLPGQATATAFFEVAQPLAFTAFQVVWLACVVVRFRHASAEEARQLRWLAGAVGLSLVVLVVGLAATGSPRAGLLTTPLIPLAAGIAIVEASYEALLREVQSSARRVVTAQDEARRRIERDLHDGAQHRLVVLGMDLGRVVERAERIGDPELASAATAARDQLLQATSELRELARGIHPSALTRDGLGSALESLAESSPLPVDLHVDVDPDCPEEAAATAYFVVSEALTNAARHSGATRVQVDARRSGSALHLVVSDDGRGGAVPGGGLRGLVDRVASLGGHLTLDSPSGRGTRVTMELPVPVTPLRVALADDALLFREGLSRILVESGFDVIGHHPDAVSLLRQVRDDPPDVVVLDLRMPPTHTSEGLDAAAEIRAFAPGVGILLLSQYVEAHYALRLMDDFDGGVGYLLKDRVSDLAGFRSDLTRVAGGDVVIDPELVRRLVGRRRRSDPLESLSDRELDVLTLMAQGCSNAALSEELHLSVKTIEAHVRSIFTKLGLELDERENRRVLAVLTFLRR